MHTVNNDLYNEAGIKEAEKNTERFKSKKKMKEVKHFINSRLFKDLDFPLDEDELDDGITEF
jgi:hypothetical protein